MRDRGVDALSLPIQRLSKLPPTKTPYWRYRMSSTKKLSTKDFILRAKKFHNDKYNYSFVEYKNMSTHVIIICPVHGKFLQTPQQHLRSCGCSKCIGRCPLNKETFIEKSKLVHGNKYEYSKVIYKTNKDMVCIICPDHGEFWQRPDSHLRGKKCAKCAKNFKDNLKSFIKKAKKVHGNMYDYSKVEYVNSQTKVCIICSKHGKFNQTPGNHISGQHCPKCQQSKGELQIENWLKEHNIQFISQKRFKKCRDKLPLPFDFYLPEINTCIEFDGEQHYRPWNHKNSIKSIQKFKRIQHHDTIKTKYCEENNITLIRISYKDDIVSLLSTIFH